MIRTLLLLGATGDLATRFLLPALGVLHAAGRLPAGFRVVGAARTQLDDEGMRRLAGDDLPADMLAYRSVDLSDAASLAAALDGTSEPVAAYLALPPGVFTTTIESLGEVGLQLGSRIIVEKPFGDDVESAHALNVLLEHACSDAYRVDHVLGMATVRNLVAMRRENPVLERLWNSDNVEQVEILWEETLALEGRAGYYDNTGALKDVLQSHLLQLFALVGTEPPVPGDADLHERKLDVLRSCRVARSRRARYTSGTLADGREVRAYTEEDGVDPARCTETFAEVTLELETPRWAGTPFVVRTGKALAARRKLVLLRLRGGGELEFGIDGPRDVVARLAGVADLLELRAPAPAERLPAYAHVLLDVLGGANALSVGAVGAEEAWRVVAPVVAAWEAGAIPIEEYAAGSSGPTS